MARLFAGINQKPKLHWDYPQIKGILHPKKKSITLVSYLPLIAWNNALMFVDEIDGGGKKVTGRHTNVAAF